jgi:hypothetical protein
MHGRVSSGAFKVYRIATTLHYVPVDAVFD